MSISQLVFKITKDTDGSDVGLTNMSLEAVRSFKVLLDSVSGIIELSPNSDKLKVNIKEGSAAIVVEAAEPCLKPIIDDYAEIIENRSAKRELVQQWKILQNLVLSNGLTYQFDYISSTGTRPLYDEIKSAKQFRTKTTRNLSDSSLVFLSGRLLEVGGKNPNFHITDKSENATTVRCTEEDAILVNHSLYKEIYISCWCKKSENSKTVHTFNDIYSDPSLFEEFKVFIKKFDESEDSDALVDLHFQMKTYLSNKDFSKLCKFINLFNHESVDTNTLKTILVITKSIESNKELLSIRSEIKSLLESKINGEII